MRKTTVMLAMVVAMVAFSVASADFVVREVDSVTGGRSPQGASATFNSWDFGRLDDFGIIGFDGPLTSAGSGPVPAGFLPDKITIDSEQDGPGGGSRGAGGGGLVGIGPSAGFGNPANAVGANFFVDALGIDFGPEGKDYFIWTAASFLGGSGYDLYVDGNFIASLDNDVTYQLSGSGFTHVSLYDPTGGAEGIYGYAEAGVAKIPEPASAALVGLMGLGMLIRRRR